jgi:hypothetical protein
MLPTAARVYFIALEALNRMKARARAPRGPLVGVDAGR